MFCWIFIYATITGGLSKYHDIDVSKGLLMIDFSNYMQPIGGCIVPQMFKTNRFNGDLCDCLRDATSFGKKPTGFLAGILFA